MTIFSYAPGGYHGHIVAVEVDCRVGIPGMDIVGLPASEVREARERARVAIRNSGFEFPAKRILVNLSPADVPKIGNGFDLAIAGAILAGSRQLLGRSPPSVMMVGELHLGGGVGAVRGVLAAVAEGIESAIGGFVVPQRNAAEAQCVSGGRAVGIAHLSELPRALAALSTRGEPVPPDAMPERDEATTARGTAKTARDDAMRSGGGPRTEPRPRVVQLATDHAHTACVVPAGTAAPRAGIARNPERLPNPAPGSALSDYRELRGLSDLKRVLEIAAAGGHHVLVVGPPGGGKSAAIGLFPTILMPLSREESIEVTRIHSLAAEARPRRGLIEQRPFRSPHHNTSTEGLLGGRLPQIPGEVALAHCGTLFLDEALEFRRPVLQGLREPLEYRRIRVARARGNYWFPAGIQLIMATNRCPCGMLGRRDRSCLCSLAEVDRYWRKLGGPLLDRIDLRVHVEPHSLEVLPQSDSSAEMARRVRTAVLFRYSTRQQQCRNGALTAVQATELGRLADPARKLLAEASRRFGLSTRASLSVLRVARTIADLCGEESVRDEHILEAVSYRRFGEERPLWECDAV